MPSIGVAIDELKERFGDRLETSSIVRAEHATKNTWLQPEPPDAVLWPTSEEDVVAAVQVCAARGCPIIPYGAGTSFEGSVNAPHGGVSIDFSRMSSIKAVNADDFDCIVEPGIRRLALNDSLKALGMFFPVDPGSNASLGGMASTSASGTNAARHGTMKQNVLALRVVLPNGDVVSTARRARKSSAGYDLTHVFVGAEGTLGLITQLTLRLQPLPEFVTAATCSFPTIEACCRAALAAMRTSQRPARIELLDEVQVAASNRHSNLALTPAPTLFLEFSGTEAGTAEQARVFGELAEAHGGTDFSWAAAEDDRATLWKARNDAIWASQALRPDARIIPTDVCVPVSRFGDCLADTKRDIEETGILAPIVGHVGDGNFHCLLLIDTTDDGEVERARSFLARLVRRAIAMDGTCTGEHGIGQGKRAYLAEELGAPALGLMTLIKRAIDPADIMNPGKILELA